MNSMYLLPYRIIILISLYFLSLPLSFSQVDASTVLADSIPERISLIVPPFFLINPDTIKLGKFDELICDSYCAKGMPSVYDALHSFNSRRSDKFGGYLNVKVNIGLENIRKKGFNSDVKSLYIQINPQTLTVYWIAVVGPSENGRCYVRLDSRGSAGGGLGAVQPQVNAMHRRYPTLFPEKILEFNDAVIQCFEWNGDSIPFFSNTINICQHFYKYYDPQIGAAISLEDYTRLNPCENQVQSALAPVIKNPSVKTKKKYKVKAGDTLGMIANKYHTTVGKIKKANGLHSDMIRIGQVLKIP